MDESSVTSRFPLSPYAAELEGGAGVQPFGAPLEAEYGQRRVAENRTLIRVATVLALVLTVARGTEQLLADAWSTLQTGQFAVVLASSVVLAALACSPWIERLYVPVAQVLVPLRNALVAITVAGVAAQGQVEALMLLPLLVIGPFFVLGLKFRAALIAVALTLVAYCSPSWPRRAPWWRGSSSEPRAPASSKAISLRSSRSATRSRA